MLHRGNNATLEGIAAASRSLMAQKKRQSRTKSDRRQLMLRERRPSAELHKKPSNAKPDTKAGSRPDLPLG
jgi:hypothetical protein